MCGVGSERHDQRLIWLQRRRSDATKPGEWQGLVASADVQLAGWRGGTGWIPLCDGLRAPATHPWLQRPQLFVSVCNDTQAVPQSFRFVLHAISHLYA